MEKKQEINGQLNEQEYFDFIERWKIENKELVKSGKAKKCFIECLPRKYGFGANAKKLLIDWNNTINSKVYFIYEDICGFIIIKRYMNSKHSKLEIIYNNSKYKIETQTLMTSQIGRMLEKITIKFKYKIGQIIKDEKRNITIIDTKYVVNNFGQKCKFYKYKCNKCEFDCGRHYSTKDKEYKDELWIGESNLLRGSGCSCCCIPSKIIVKGINDILTLYPDMIKYFINIEDSYKYTFGSSEKTLFKCPDCGSNVKMIINKVITRGISCKACGDGISYPNKFMFNMLEQLNIDFINEYSPEWIGDKRYDFYIPSMNLIIEMDGGLGHGNKVYNNEIRTIKETENIDQLKDEYANNNNINIIRIDCYYEDLTTRFNYIIKSVINKLINVFDLSKINWQVINELSTRNLIKEASKYKKENPNLTSSDILKLIGEVSTKSTIIEWLKIGNQFGWCEYDAKEEMKKSNSKNSKKSWKPVIILKDNIILGVYQSGAFLSKKSKYLFGVKLQPQGIGQVCIGNISQYKGYTFKFVSDLTQEEYIQYDIENKLKELKKTA